MGYYDTDLRFNYTGQPTGSKAGAAAAIGKMGEAFMQLGDDHEKRKQHKEALDLEKSKLDYTKQKEADAAAQKVKDKAAKVSAFRKKHPKTTEGLTDDEVYQMGDKITQLHTNGTKKMKFVESFTAANGDRIGVFFDGSTDKDNKPVYQNIVLGKAKDFSSGSTNKAPDPTEDGKIYVKDLDKHLTPLEYNNYLKERKNLQKLTF